MRDAVIIGLLYAAVGALMTALVTKYAGPLFWDIMQWGAVALIFGCVASLWLSYSHQLTGRPFWMPALLINLGLCLITAGFVWHYSPTLSGKTVIDVQKEKIAMARRWIRLADDIQADLPSLSVPPSTFLPNFTPEQRHVLWLQDTQRSMTDASLLMSRLKQKYSGRLARARDEMQENSIQMQPLLGADLLNLTNQFSFQRWIEKLGSEGRKILTENGESAD